MTTRRDESQKSAGTLLKLIMDLVLGLVIAVIAAIPMILTALFIKLTSRGPALHWSKRVGKNNQHFMMPKFRTMHLDTPQVATHLLTDPKKFLIVGGALIRKLSLDELPQLYSVFVGDMSLVGPRPALHNQHDLIALRTEKGIHRLKPGVTGWAQINGRDELSITKKVEVDEYYLHNQSFFLDCKITILTVGKVLGMKGVSH